MKEMRPISIKTIAVKCTANGTSHYFDADKAYIVEEIQQDQSQTVRNVDGYVICPKHHEAFPLNIDIFLQ
jgi:hypothetical protein